jgi:hypothetical protein
MSGEGWGVVMGIPLPLVPFTVPVDAEDRAAVDVEVMPGDRVVGAMDGNGAAASARFALAVAVPEVRQLGFAERSVAHAGVPLGWLHVR